MTTSCDVSSTNDSDGEQKDVVIFVVVCNEHVNASDLLSTLISYLGL